MKTNINFFKKINKNNKIKESFIKSLKNWKIDIGSINNVEFTWKELSNFLDLNKIKLEWEYENLKEYSIQLWYKKIRIIENNITSNFKLIWILSENTLSKPEKYLDIKWDYNINNLDWFYLNSSFPTNIDDLIKTSISNYPSIYDKLSYSKQSVFNNLFSDFNLSKLKDLSTLLNNNGIIDKIEDFNDFDSNILKYESWELSKYSIFKRDKDKATFKTRIESISKEVLHLKEIYKYNSKYIKYKENEIKIYNKYLNSDKYNLNHLCHIDLLKLDDEYMWKNWELLLNHFKFNYPNNITYSDNIIKIKKFLNSWKINKELKESLKNWLEFITEPFFANEKNYLTALKIKWEIFWKNMD